MRRRGASDVCPLGWTLADGWQWVLAGMVFDGGLAGSNFTKGSSVLFGVNDAIINVHQ